ncbi:DUF3168 domain-containing protein [Chitinophaga sp. MM2321]|uniref:DUF3168 domain-containing protein n=1 Tax=Chitinophaga sp. MM2321 TaxID=3137178 RepID=UPI0032D59881
MQDTNYSVRKAYFQALQGFVIVGLTAIEVYDKMAPNNAVYPYIILSTQTDTDNSVKECFGHECTMLVDVVTGFNGAVESEMLDSICGQILNRINPSGQRLTLTNNLQLISTKLISDNTIEGQNGVWKILRRLLRFAHNVHEQVNI